MAYEGVPLHSVCGGRPHSMRKQIDKKKNGKYVEFLLEGSEAETVIMLA